MRIVLMGLMALLVFGSVSAFDIDFVFNLNEEVNSFLVSLGASYSTDISGDEGEVFYLKGVDNYSTCSSGASLWDSNISQGSINFSISELVEIGMDLKLEIDGVDYDLNVNQADYSFPINGVGERVCLKVIGGTGGVVKLVSTSNDFNVMES